jgi:microfibrillar-associated protein 1
MTANPVKPARYRPGKPIADEPSSEEEEDDEAELSPAPTPPPKATSFPSDATKIASNLKQVDLNERKRQAALAEAARLEAEKAARAKEEEGFVTEESEEEEEGTDDADEESESGSEESTSEEEAPKLHLRPTFIKKDKRKEGASAAAVKTEDELWAEEEARRKAKADAMIQEQLEKNAAAKAAGKKSWDDDEDEDADQVDDTDGLDPETERAAWKLRELKRVKREREAIEVAEKEREEVERRRNLSREEREAEDKEFLDKQKEEREGKGKMGYMQKYFHKGAFFQDDAKAEGLDRRDIMGSRYQDDVTNRELLPQYMQIRDMAKLGRKGRTKYKDLKTEDTGRWGVVDPKRPRRTEPGVVDERFMPDQHDREKGGGASGANTTAVKPRRTAAAAPEGAPQGPRGQAGSRPEGVSLKGGDTYRPREHESGGDSNGRAARRSPYSKEEEGDHSRRRERSRDKGYRVRDDDRDGYSNEKSRRRSPRRRRSYSRSRSRSRRRERSVEDRRRRKRSPSPYYRERERDRERDRDGYEKRRRIDMS